MRMTERVSQKRSSQRSRLKIRMASRLYKAYDAFMQKLMPEKIEAELPVLQKLQLRPIAYFDTLTSTNRYLLENAEPLAEGVQICLAEQQSAGQAQHGRNWVSPYACNMYLSILWPFQHKSLAQLSGLSIAVGVAIVRALISYGLNPDVLHLKWPNDIYANGKKLCGILCQTAKQQDQVLPCVIGIGLNIIMPAEIQIDQPYTDVHSLSGQTPDRNRIIGCCIREVLTACEQYSEQALMPFLAEFRRHDYLLGKSLTLTIGQQQSHGTSQGIDAEGYLLFKDAAGRIKRFASGEASIKKA